MKEKALIIVLCLSISFFLISFNSGAWQNELQMKGIINTGSWEIALKKFLIQV